MNNSIMTIRPYRISGGVWVFDDEALGIHREPFVGDINKMIDGMLERAGLPAGKQFTAMFSANPFPGVQMVLKWLREESGGNWYGDISLALANPIKNYFEDPKMVEGWLCPVLFKFFCEAPKNIYVRAES